MSLFTIFLWNRAAATTKLNTAMKNLKRRKLLSFLPKKILFICFTPRYTKKSHNAVETMQRGSARKGEKKKVENVEQQQTVQAGRKITCKHIRDDV